METITPEARLVDAGWDPPTEALRLAIARREALRSAVAALKTRGQADVLPVQIAIGEADKDSIISALVQHAIGRWLDANCQTDVSELYEWSQAAEHALAKAIHDAAPAVLVSLAGIDSPDAGYLRAVAEQAVAATIQLVGPNGQPAPPRLGPVSRGRVLIAR